MSREEEYYARMRYYQYMNISACGAAAKARRAYCYIGNSWEKDMTSIMVLEFLRLTNGLPEEEVDTLAGMSNCWLDAIR